MQTTDKLKVCEGLTKPQIKQLIKFTNTDLLILKTTKDLERFKDNETYNNWIKKNRIIYSLTNSSGDLLGIIWFGIKQMPKNEHFIESINSSNYSITFAIRLYESARGKGLSKYFIKKTWDLYSNSKDYIQNLSKGIWLETNINNFPAINTYKKFGFKLITKPDEKGRVLMIQS